MSVEACILAGGASSRFGSPKVLLRIGGRSVVETIAAAVREALPDAKVRLVASSDGQVLPVKSGIPVVTDLYPGRGPLSGLHAGLAYAAREWVLALACDYPFLTGELLSWLWSMAGDDMDAVVPVQADGRLQPLCAFYRRAACLPIVEGMVASPRPAPPLCAVFEQVRSREVSFDEVRDLPGADRFFSNINTPRDLELHDAD
jgi:molybdopterin-guanine dinucleotide biosynthesis protein A